MKKTCDMYGNDSPFPLPSDWTAEKQREADKGLPKRYRKLPVVIVALRLEKTRESILQGFHFVYADLERSDDDLYQLALYDDGIKIKTLEGTMYASFGDYIIRGVKGEFYPCKPDIFEKTYEAVD